MKSPHISLRPLLASAILSVGVAMFAQADPVDWMQFDHAFTMAFPGYTGNTTLENFPVLVKVSENNGSGFLYSRCKDQNGGDLRFSDAEGNLLPSEIEFWDPSGTSYVWVRVPSLNASTKITAYYGNANPPSVTASDVWANGYVAVWHLNADANATTQTDSTANALTLTEFQPGNTRSVESGVPGAVGAAARFGLQSNYTGSYYLDDPDNKLSGFSKFTLETWSYQNDHAPIDAPKDNYYINYQNRSTSTKIYGMMEYHNNGMTLFLLYPDGSTYTDLYNDAVEKPAQALWNHHAFRFDGQTGTRTGFLNGNNIVESTDASRFAVTLPSASGTLYVGNSYYWNGNAPSGKLDEVRISNVARSDDWVKATYDTVKTDGFAVYAETALKNDWTKFTHRFTVTFDGYAGSTTLAGFPVLVKVSPTDIPGFRYTDCLKSDGGDLRFADEQGNVLPSEVEVWDTTGTSYVWVGIPSLTPTNDNPTKITGYYGWTLALDVTSSDVWTNGYVAVWHLNAEETSTIQTDATANSFVLTASTPDNVLCVTGGVSGVVGTAAEFDKGIDGKHKGAYYMGDSENKLAGFSAYTFEVWSWQNDHDPSGATGRYYMRNYGTTTIGETKVNIEAFRFQEHAGDGKAVFTAYYTDSSDQQTYQDDPITPPARAAWNHQVFTMDNTASPTTRRVYLNGEAIKKTTGSTGTLNSPGGTFYLGNSGTWDASAFPGKLDEVRISNVARSDDWVKATYDTIMSASFATVSSARENRLGVVILMR